MRCNRQEKKCGCEFNLTKHGACNPANIIIDGRFKNQLNWNEISVPEIVCVPEQKPDIEHIDEVFVNAVIDCVKLIKTPFSYEVFERVANALEIAAVTNIVALGQAVIVQPVIDAVNDILDIIGLPSIPAVEALQVALDAVIAANNAFLAALTALDNALDLTCISATLLNTLLVALQTATNLLQLALDALIVAANALVAAVTAINPVIGALVEAAVDILLTAVQVVVDAILLLVDAITGALLLIGNTTYFTISGNEEGTCLSGRKLVVEGTLKQKIVYTGLVDTQSVHSTHNSIPFTAYIIPYAKFEGITEENNVELIVDPVTCATETVSAFPFDPEEDIIPDICEGFCVNAYVEDIFAYALDPRTVFKNITLFLKANPESSC